MRISLFFRNQMYLILNGLKYLHTNGVEYGRGMFYKLKCFRKNGSAF